MHHRYDLVIDGYNLMHASGHARERYAPGDLQRCRERFLLWVWKRVPETLRERTIIVFDAGDTDNQYTGLATFRELRLLYSPRGVEADDLIEDLVASHSAPKRLQVVSSDHRLHKASRKRKAACIDSEAFVATLARAARRQRELERQQREEAKPTADLPDQVEDWLRIFADVQPLADRERLSPPKKPKARVPQRRAAPPASPPSEASPAPVTSQPQTTRPAVIPGDELAFWEERLRDLLHPSHDKPPRATRRPNR
jgi:predicted RNA-binding protein with PIN domain